MRKITKITANAFANFRACKLSNSYVDYGINGHMYYFLHDNLIADYDQNNEKLTIMDAWRQSNTTKERLNGILSVFWLGGIFQKNYQRYYTENGKEEKRNWQRTFDLN